MNILGDKNFAFLGGALIGIWLLLRYKGKNFKTTFDLLTPALGSGAVIALITCAGGSFGKALAEAGIGSLIEQAARQWEISLMLLAYLTATLIRIAQGSATVSMITTAGIISTALTTMNLPYHPVYLVCVIGFGATGFTWMNDSGFWIFSQMTGLSETQTLKTWTVLLTVMSFTGFLWVLILSSILPLV